MDRTDALSAVAVLLAAVFVCAFVTAFSRLPEEPFRENVHATVTLATDSGPVVVRCSDGRAWTQALPDNPAWYGDDGLPTPYAWTEIEIAATLECNS